MRVERVSSSASGSGADRVRPRMARREEKMASFMLACG